MKAVVVADPTTPPAAESVRKETEKLAQAVETAAEEVKPVAEAAPKKKKGCACSGTNCFVFVLESIFCDLA